MASSRARTEGRAGRIAAPLARLSTGTKMLLILTVALLPLGLIALFASIQSDQARRAQRAEDARVLATAEARQLDILLLRGSGVLRMALSEGTAGPRCGRLLARNAAAFPTPIALAVFNADGNLRCSTPGFAAAGAARPGAGVALALRLLDRPARLRFASAAPDGSYGVGEMPVAMLRRVVPTTGGAQGITIAQGGVALPLVVPTRAFPLGRHVAVRVPFAGGQGVLALVQVINPVSAVEVLLVLLPLLMWGAAAGIGWVVVDHLLLRPLAELQRAVTAYRPGQGGFDLPPITSPAREIGTLGDAFAEATGQIAEREARLEEGLDRQVRLTREVHHRVKNNLQVVASLINLHSRGTRGDVAAAYASIQRRVDALAVVHRNHYAELEENRGVALRSIVAELTGNLRATAPPEAGHLVITLDMVPAFVTQDVAVPVAFLLTEIVELVMACDPAGTVAVSLTATADPARALLAVDAPGLTSAPCMDHPARDRFQRIVTGLSRQLRSELHFDAATGGYRILLAVLPQEPGTAGKN